jgi:hypothetical protein
MKTMVKFIGRAIVGCAFACCLSLKLHAQADLTFTGVSATDERNIQLNWVSASNEIYEIDEADSLIPTNTGSTIWNVLYQDYPSQGTNTFWLDTGNYNLNTPIVNPTQSPMRFYRIVLEGTNTTTDVPTVSILTPTNSTTTNGTIAVTVLASSDQYFLATKLYVDGQEMNEADETTNWTDSTGVTNYVEDTYFVDSCEWPNGSHTLFATCYCQTGPTGAHDAPTVYFSYGVSPFVPVTFDNLITRISFTQPFFAPEDGTTQIVTAAFTENANWTLNILDVSNNTVRTSSGTGDSMQFNWDGNDGSGNPLPVGTYTYQIVASTNGEAFDLGMASESSSSSAFDDALQWWVEPSDDSGAPVPLALYPPGFDTNGLSIFEASGSEVEAVMAASRPSHASLTTAYSAGGAAAADADTPASQTASAPTRPPINPVRGRAGVYGYAYDTYSANGAYYQLSPPGNGILSQTVNLEGYTTVSQSTFKYDPLVYYKTESANFVLGMRKGNWSQGFAKADDQWSYSDLVGSGSMFNSVKLGLVLLHGTWGSAPDYTSGAGGCKQMYFPVTSGHSATYVRMSQMSLGNSATNGLKWMAIAACNSLYHTDWSNMQSMGCHPYNSALHLLLGTDSVVYTDNHIMQLWAQYMTKGRGTNTTPLTIGSAWTTAANDAYHQSKYNYPITMKFAVAGDSACTSDTLSSTTTPGGSWTYNSTQVYP